MPKLDPRPCLRCGGSYRAGTYFRHKLNHLGELPKPSWTAPRNAEREDYILSGVAAGRMGQAIADELGISRERVRQIYTRATGLPLPRYGTRCRVCGETFFARHDRVGYADHIQTWKHQLTLAERSVQVRRASERRFWSKVKKGTGCWEWTGRHFREGYAMGSVARFRNQTFAHRLAYQLVKGDIPEGLTLDHLCRNRGCVNPDHLEAVTHRENILRSPIAPAAINARKTRCRWGHPFDEANTNVNDKGYRCCRACGAIKSREQTARKAAARRLARERSAA